MDKGGAPSGSITAETPAGQHKFICLLFDGQGGAGSDDGVGEDVIVSEARLVRELEKGWGQWIGDDVLDALISMMEPGFHVARGVRVEHVILTALVCGATALQARARGELFRERNRYHEVDVIIWPLLINDNHWIMLEVLLNYAVINIYDSAGQLFKQPKAKVSLSRLTVSGSACE